MNPVAVAVRGKGGLNLARRTRAIGSRYGLGPSRMEQRLADVFDIVQRHGCSATLPVTAAAAERHAKVIACYAARGIEFAVHGLYHVDHAALSAAEQVEQLGRARRLLQAHGIHATGFRAPYLRWTDATLHAIRETGFLYDASPAVHWPVAPELATEGYRRGLTFYGSVPATANPVVPWLDEGLVRIPYCLPDDESVSDRLHVVEPEAIGRLWLGVLDETYRRGELFTLAVHPERITSCGPAVGAVLAEARRRTPTVWVASLDEIARWWRDRAESVVTVRDDGADRFHVRVQGPPGLTVLSRLVDAPGGQPWGDGYGRILGTRFDLRAVRRPFIGVHPSSPGPLVSFLREQGYIVEISDRAEAYPRFVRRDRFESRDRRPLLDDLEAGRFPIVRLGRWPNGARSALSVTGDIDALTIWDYALRFVGR